MGDVSNMTRFARSKGSKSSNERIEEEATPWEELRNDVEPLSKKKFNVEDLEDDDEPLIEENEHPSSSSSESEEDEPTITIEKDEEVSQEKNWKEEKEEKPK